ncbi:MAG: alginate O-acetyltransferase complex protein AlgI [Arenicella sp.]|jgi:alginate O-acetyltransferase complex protein AlgI
MVFSSPIFLFYFLPSLLLLYFCTPKSLQNLLLLAASLLFYAWGEGFYLLLMVLSIGINYVFGRLIESRSDKRILVIGVALNLSILLAYKYANFIVSNSNLVFEFLGLPQLILDPVHLPLGISFFTFQAISYLVDIKRGEINSQKNLINLGLYISMFPQLIAGPIVRYKTINKEIDSRETTPELFVHGMERFILGLAKKMLIANPLGAVVDSIFSLPIEALPAHVVWFGVLLYALQIYYDFSGYSDMAIGLGRMLGFRFLENFNYPYSAQSLQDFWRRWHISLSTWFRDYLYIPLGGNRRSEMRTYFNLFIVFILCGLWHGASWNFFAWGVFHGVFLALERAGLSTVVAALPKLLRHLYLLIVVLVSWVLFRAETLTDALDYLTVMFGFKFFSVPFEFIDAINPEVMIALLFGLIFSFPGFYHPSNSVVNTSSTKTKLVLTSSLRYSFLFALLLLSVMQLAASTHNPFIYFRF